MCALLGLATAQNLKPRRRLADPIVRRDAASVDVAWFYDLNANETGVNGTAFPDWLGAVAIGGGSALSFPLGAILGIYFHISERGLAILLSFGAGAVLFALTIELFANSLHEEFERDVDGKFRKIGLLASTLIGALLFTGLNSLLGSDDEQGHKQPRKKIMPMSHYPSFRVATGVAHLYNTMENDGSMDMSTIGISASKTGGAAGASKAATAMWLGVLLDGIPESMVFGLFALKSVYSIPLALGVFLGNFPEAASSASMLRAAGKSNLCIFCMWGSLVVTTSLGAALTTIIFPNSLISDVKGQESLTEIMLTTCAEGVAAGAMLAMVSSTMLPEAFEKGGSQIVSLTTVLGFLSAFGIKMLREL